MLAPVTALVGLTCSGLASGEFIEEKRSAQPRPTTEPTDTLFRLATRLSFLN